MSSQHGWRLRMVRVFTLNNLFLYVSSELNRRNSAVKKRKRESDYKIYCNAA